MAILPPIYHNRLVDAGNAARRARSSSGKETKAHSVASRDLQHTIDSIMTEIPWFFREAALIEMEVRQREQS